MTWVKRVGRRVLRALPDELGRTALRLTGRVAPYVHNEPPAPPPGTVLAPPDFVGIGAQRSGTTWWYELLTDHPDVYSSPKVDKELHFFDQFWQREEAAAAVTAYRDWFPRPPGSISGEWTPVYMLYPWVAPMVAESAPGAKILVMLRDPVARFWSGINFAATALDMRITRSVVMEAISRGLYAHQLGWWEEWFPPEQILVLQFEACISAPEVWLAKTYEFLGLDTSHSPDQLETVKNPLREKAYLEDREFNQLLTEHYKHDVIALQALRPEIDLAFWSSFSHLTTGTDRSQGSKPRE